MEADFKLVQYIATCTTGDCENAGISIEVSATENDPYVICGPCSTQITDLTQLTETRETE
jgi:hypothetical protein